MGPHWVWGGGVSLFPYGSTGGEGVGAPAVGVGVGVGVLLLGVEGGGGGKVFIVCATMYYIESDLLGSGKVV